MLDEAGKIRAALGLLADGSAGINFRTQDEKARLGMILAPTGGGGVIIKDDEEKLRGFLGILSNSSPSLTLRDRHEKIIWTKP